MYVYKMPEHNHRSKSRAYPYSPLSPLSPLSSQPSNLNKMHFPTILSFLPLAAAFPVELPSLHSLLPRALTDTTQNDLTNGSPCKALTVLFARGTDSPGNVGTNTGPAFFQAIASLIGANNVAIQGIDYPASIIGFLQGG